MEKITKTSNIIKTILKILFWISAVVSVVSLVAILIALFANGDATKVDNLSITLGSYSLLLNQEYSLQQLTPLLCITLANVFILGILSCYTIKTLQSVFEPMSQGKPFSTTISSALKKLSYVVLLMGIIGIILQTATNYMFFNAFDIPTLFSKDRVISCSISIVSNGNFIIWFVILRLISHIFKYGETLQQLSDETL